MSFPITVNLNGACSVDIHLHTFFLGDRDRQCWTYITRGFASHGQREMSLSLLVEEEGTQEYPKTPLKMFELLEERTRTDRKLLPTDATLLGQKGIFGFPSLFFLPAIQFPDLPSLDEHLALVLVHQEEYDYARQHGLTRFLSRLGKFCSSFPYPTWNTQARPSLFTDSARELTLLADASHLRATRSFIHQSGNVLSLTLHRDNVDMIEKAISGLSPDQVITICTGFSPACDASLYWQEGQPEAGAYASEARQSGVIGGSFVTLERADAGEFSIVEDGYSLALTEIQLGEITHALKSGSALALPLGGGQEMQLSVMQGEPSLAARLYEPRATWRSLGPAGTGITAAPSSKGKVVLGAVTNLMGNNTLEDNVSKPELQGYLTQVEHTLTEALSDETMQFHFNLDILIEEDRAEPTLSSDMELNPAFVSFIEELVGRILPCEVWSPVHIRLPFRVNESK